MALLVPAAAQQYERIHPALLKMLGDDEEVQKQLIAAGSLDAPVGRASRSQLQTAIARFRKAYGFKRGFGPLTDEERTKLKAVFVQFAAATGWNENFVDLQTGVKLLLPEKLVGVAAQAALAKDKDWPEYRAEEGALSIGPEKISLSKETPISLFRTRILSAAGHVTYRKLLLSAEEFTAIADVTLPQPGKEDLQYHSHNHVLTDGDQLKGLWIRYNIQAPGWFKVSDFEFLMPTVEVEPAEPDSSKLDTRQRAWQLLMRSVTNLVTSSFPFDNGARKVSTKRCPLAEDMSDAQPGRIRRILFATDRRKTATAPKLGETAKLVDPDALFTNAPDHRLRMGCAYVTLPAAGEDGSTPLARYHLFHEGEAGDLGDRSYLTDDIGPTRASKEDWIGGDALVFVHGYRVSFKEAIKTVAQFVADTKYQGRIYLYSWPSHQTTLGYFQDLDNAEQAEPYFQSFMRMLMRDAHINEIDVIAHSMGSQTMLRAVSALRSLFDTESEEPAPGGGRRGAIRVGQMIFAASDIAPSVFEEKIRRIAPFADRVTVYVSGTDWALSTSKIVRGGLPRLGELGPPFNQPALIDSSKVHMIDVTPGQTFLQRLTGGGYGHDYLVTSKGVRDDVGEILKGRGDADTQTPDERSKTRFVKKTYEGTKDRYYWQLQPQQ